MKIRFLGHACFLLESGPHKILIDPFLSGNPGAGASADSVECTMIFVTHGHHDHLGDAEAIARRTGAPIFGLVDVVSALPQDLTLLSGNTGGRQELPFGAVKIVNAIHGSGIPGALACGFVFELEGKRIYHAGDTALTMDMQLLADEHIDLALLPIGDFYTMGPDDALRAVKLIRPRCVVPMHFNTFPAIRQDGAAFCARVRAEAGCDAALLEVGQSLEL